MPPGSFGDVPVAPPIWLFPVLVPVWVGAVGAGVVGAAVVGAIVVGAPVVGSGVGETVGASVTTTGCTTGACSDGAAAGDPWLVGTVGFVGKNGAIGASVIGAADGGCVLARDGEKDGANKLATDGAPEREGAEDGTVDGASVNLATCKPTSFPLTSPYTSVFPSGETLWLTELNDDARSVRDWRTCTIQSNPIQCAKARQETNMLHSREFGLYAVVTRWNAG